MGYKTADSLKKHLAATGARPPQTHLITSIEYSTTSAARIADEQVRFSIAGQTKEMQKTPVPCAVTGVNSIRYCVVLTTCTVPVVYYLFLTQELCECHLTENGTRNLGSYRDVPRITSQICNQLIGMFLRDPCSQESSPRPGSAQVPRWRQERR